MPPPWRASQNVESTLLRPVPPESQGLGRTQGGQGWNIADLHKHPFCTLSRALIGDSARGLSSPCETSWVTPTRARSQASCPR